MQEFSGLYKKMCEKAKEVQDFWEPEEWDECCKKGDHEEDGIVKQYHPGMLSDEEKKSFKDNHTWLPTSDQLRERAWKTWRYDSIRKLKEKEYLKFYSCFIIDIYKTFLVLFSMIDAHIYSFFGKNHFRRGEKKC